MNESSARPEEALDAAARAAAIAPGDSVLLEAPAGSGKTSVLTRRFLTLLTTVEDPGEILAITFTRKAAAEMQARVIRALRGEFDPSDPEAAQLTTLAAAALAHGAARGWSIAAQPQSLRILTIDAFNYWLASQLPVASHAGGVLKVTEGAGELYRRAARRTLLEADTDPALAGEARLLFERTDNHWMYLERLLAEMLAERGHWLPFVSGKEPQVLCQQVNESLANLAQAHLRAACALIPEGLRRRAERLPGSGPLGATPADLPHWKHLAHLVLTKDDWRKQLIPHRLGAAFSDPLACQELRDLIDELRRLAGAREALLGLKKAPAARLGEEDVAAIEALSRILSRAAAELHAEFAQLQRVDYTYVTGAARQALTEDGEPTDLALRAGLRLRHILVDEFQDTSLAQVQLLEALTAGWEEGDGRTLFVVGDAMQSIYRFRQAEVGLFLRARETGIGELRLKPLRLLRNFRAVPELVAFTNDTFAQVFPQADDRRTGAVSYRSSLATRSAAPLIAPLSLKLFPQDAGAEAGAIAAHIAQLRQLDPQASVAVLVVAHAHAVPIVAALTAGGIPTCAVDLVPLRERLVVRDLVQLTRALFDLSDRTAWLAVLRAPWCGARLKTLTALSGVNDRELILEALGNAERLARCEPLDLPRLERLRSVLMQALTERGETQVADWLEWTWVRLGASDAYEAPELEDARAFFAALAARSTALEWQGPEDFAALLEHLYSSPRSGENPVQVMTIHRAKGLEFEHVIVPALQRATRGAEHRLLRWIDLPGDARESDLLISPLPPVGAMEESDLNAFIRDLIRQRDAHERCRLMYVAATRARRTLWLSAAPEISTAGSVKPDRRSMLAVLWPALAERFETIESASPAPATPTTSAPLTRLGANWQPPPVPAAVRVTQLPPAYLASEPLEFSWVRETQRDIGTVVHAWLLRLSGASQLPRPAELEKERAVLLAQLARLGVPPSEQPRAAEVILTALRQTLSDPQGCWILSGGHREARSEWELSGVASGRLRNVRIDRSFIDAAGVRWVIDYKTSSHEGSDVEGFLAQEVERYRPQLAGYVELAQALLGAEVVRAALYFPLLGAFREVI